MPELCAFHKDHGEEIKSIKTLVDTQSGQWTTLLWVGITFMSLIVVINWMSFTAQKENEKTLMVIQTNMISFIATSGSKQTEIWRRLDIHKGQIEDVEKRVRTLENGWRK